MDAMKIRAVFRAAAAAALFVGTANGEQELLHIGLEQATAQSFGEDTTTP
jgi:hypothetical protein